jgi:ABC-type uncharacterized transport system permease subunit
VLAYVLSRYLPAAYVLPAACCCLLPAAYVLSRCLPAACCLLLCIYVYVLGLG